MVGGHPLRLLPLATIGAIAAATLVASATAGTTGTADDPPPADSAVIQYTELVPTSKGAKAPGVGTKTRAQLPPKAKRALRDTPAKTTKALVTVSTSSDYGAPATAQPRTAPSKAGPPTRTKPPRRDALSPNEEPSLERTLSATAVAAAPVDDARMLGLLVALVGIAVAGAVLAARARRT